MSEFNLNDDQFQESNSSNVTIFNGGKAGLSPDGVKLRIEKKSADDKPNSPDFKIIATDANGGEVNSGVWYPKATGDDERDARSMQTFGQILNHLIHTYLGPDAKAPTGTMEEVTNAVIDKLKEPMENTTVRVFTNYNTLNNPKSYMQLRKYVPFVELDSVDVANTRLTPKPSEQLERPQPDEQTTPQGATEAATEADW